MRKAYANRLSKREIHTLTGLARTTIDQILAQPDLRAIYARFTIFVATKIN